MSRTKVFALPLFHEDSNEYLRVRRGIDIIAGARSDVAYELPKNPLSERLLNVVLGRSGRDLDTEIMRVLTEFHAPQPEIALCDLMELDRAKHSGKIRDIYPIDIDPSLQTLKSDNPEYLKFMLRMGQKTDQLNAAILHPYPFRNVLFMVRDIVALESEGFELKEARIKENIEQILGMNQEERLLVMSGALHIPSIESMLKHDGVDVVETDAPEKVSGIWWTAYAAISELREARESGIADPYGPELIRYALLVSLNLVKAVRLNEFNKGGSGFVSGEEAKSIRGISTFADAESFYDTMQRRYGEGFEDSVIDLSKLHRD